MLQRLLFVDEYYLLEYVNDEFELFPGKSSIFLFSLAQAASFHEFNVLLCDLIVDFIEREILEVFIDRLLILDITLGHSEHRLVLK